MDNGKKKCLPKKILKPRSRISLQVAVFTHVLMRYNFKSQKEVSFLSEIN